MLTIAAGADLPLPVSTGFFQGKPRDISFSRLKPF